jgi:cellulose synthase/poly-beta-1,6-N-acetylglucosamine synthase-like glycosyltransferase
MNGISLGLVGAPLALFGYAYAAYPLLLRAGAAFRPRKATAVDPEEWPRLTITVPVYNEAGGIRAKLEELLAVDYPADRRRVLVISDASTDTTDDIVREFADRGVSLLRQSTRAGKTAAENAAAGHLWGDLVVNTDATTRLLPDSLKALVRAFADPTVGVASGRDVSVGAEAQLATGGEAGYVGYEMWIRALETRVGSIVGVSGCFYGIRRSLYDMQFPEDLSRDFGCALSARERGYRAVSVDEAVCVVPRAGSLGAEFRRKVRTMQRGLRTLWYKRALLDPFRYGSFAFMLASHKLARWVAPLTLPLSLVGMAMLAAEVPTARVLLGLAIAGIVVGTIGMQWPEGRRLPRLLALPAFALAANVAGVRAWFEALRPGAGRIWEPTRRPA